MIILIILITFPAALSAPPFALAQDEDPAEEQETGGEAQPPAQARPRLFITAADPSTAPQVTLRAYGLDHNGAPLNLATERLVVRHDGDDPYMVVAADKGTASFSDIANEISQAYRHWLGDAFASGGSQGYDHKKMGITARGAWVCVQRHFLQRGLDVQSQDFTVVGIGDMAGDVFGNGMLRSEHIKLVAAFNHLHIFIDPDPDTTCIFSWTQIPILHGALKSASACLNCPGAIGPITTKA